MVDITPLRTELFRFIEDVGPAPPDMNNGVAVHLYFANLENSWQTNGQSIIDKLVQKFPTDHLIAMSAEMYFNPATWQIVDGTAINGNIPVWWIYRKSQRIASVLERILLEYQPDSIHIDIETFLKREFESQQSYYRYPKLHDCLRLLTCFRSTADLLDLAKRIVTGEFHFGEDTAAKSVYPGSNLELVLAFDDLINYLADHEQLDYFMFRQSALSLPQILTEITYARRQTLKPSEKITEMTEGFHRKLIEEASKELTLENYRTILNSHIPLRGSEYLLRAAESHARLHLDKLTVQKWWHWSDNIESAVIRLAMAEVSEPDTLDDRQTFIKQLQSFLTKTLERLLPVAAHSRILICEALGWEKAIPLIDLLVDSANLHIGYGGFFTSSDVLNSSDPQSGVINVLAVKTAIDSAGESLTKKILRLFRESKVGVSNTLMLFEAVMGWNRVKVEEGVKKHNQISIKAYGLLPLERGDAEVIERYRALQQAAKDGQKFGQQRRANQAAAAQVGLANLVQLAGYADLNRFEWAMESKIAQEVAAPDRKWSVRDYQLRLSIEGTDAAIVISRDDKVLKSVPKDVRNHTSYKEAKEAVMQFRSQIARIRTGVLEAALVRGDRFTQDELTQFHNMPAARAMLERLIIRTADEKLGLYIPDKQTIQDVNGTEHKLNGEIQIAHPYHLYQAGELAAWQRFLVHERIVQPFKQAFRELYLLTPAEVETQTYSNRFAGHLVVATTTAKLLTSRGWKIESGDYPVPYKHFSGMRAVFDFEGVYHFFGGDQPTTSDRIHFEPYPIRWESGKRPEDYWLPLTDIDPLIFSEVMRDADLVVSVAQREGETRLSNETYAQRGTLVETLLDDLGLPGVTVDGHHAYVQGKLAKYKVHLGSAVIHIEPGNYLCIVPDRWGKKHDKLFLPFADEGDSKISEVISKILLLAADDKIKDESILRQIRR